MPHMVRLAGLLLSVVSRRMKSGCARYPRVSGLVASLAMNSGPNMPPPAFRLPAWASASADFVASFVGSSSSPAPAKAFSQCYVWANLEASRREHLCS